MQDQNINTTTILEYIIKEIPAEARRCIIYGETPTQLVVRLLGIYKTQALAGSNEQPPTEPEV